MSCLLRRRQGLLAGLVSGQQRTSPPTAPLPQHTVSDIFCRVCAQNLGWRYEYAYEESQRYKVRESRVLSCGRIGGRLVGLTHLTPSLCHWQVGKVVIEREKMVDAVQHLG